MVYLFRLHYTQSNDLITNTDICYKNMLQFKRFADSLKYNRPVGVIIDNTKLKEYLNYSATLGCIIRSILPILETKVSN